MDNTIIYVGWENPLKGGRGTDSWNGGLSEALMSDRNSPPEALRRVELLIAALQVVSLTHH